MTIQNVVICDDNTERVARWKALIERELPEVVVKEFTGVSLAKLIRALDDKEQIVRNAEGDLSDESRASIDFVDAADLVIVDSELSPQPHDLEAITDKDERREVALTLRGGYGDSVARQMRSYTNAGLLVVVNMFWSRHALPRVFDLTLAQEAFAAADLYIMDAELSDPALWARGTNESSAAYLPWRRVSIPVLHNSFERSMNATIDMDARLFETLSIDPTKLTARQLDPFDKAPAEVTFGDLAIGRLGFRYPTAAHSEEAIDRMARSAARRWVERFVVSAQNVLLDAPHLFERYWRLLGKSPEDLEDWTATRALDWPTASTFAGSAALSPGLEAFAPRPLYDDALAREATASLGRLDSGERRNFSGAFAEDTSSFYPVEELKSFPTDVSGSFSRRWVKEINGIGYEPANRLLL